ncbi:low molecular weight protein-tyrosine-phosphatase [Phytoactinopolyspora endophytica]|uniref:low molecular weight protein-tyrosine-phosphatase n=1 Tax=Phytoactinopolyspora endophytica TaxID=1642495 RepID=UPI00101CE98D|nr:low molecular weight protein-tyrosine-phosphatase [Phytoactinopolyspora endophytica]
MTAPFAVCVVCAGNICRSPMAEVVLRSRLADAGLSDAVTIESAGTGGWHVGDPADPRAQRTLQVNGYDATGHKARQFTASWFENFDLVLALDRSNFADVRGIAPDETARRKVKMLRSYAAEAAGDNSGDLDVPDPYYGGEDGFDHVLSLVEEAADSFVQALRLNMRQDAGDSDTPRQAS